MTEAKRDPVVGHFRLVLTLINCTIPVMYGVRAQPKADILH
jgi:hypothetical protein